MKRLIGTLQEQDFEALAKMRQSLHAMPELSGEEYLTASHIKALLTGFSPDTLIERIGGTGVAAVFTGSEPGDTVMIRCELDGLPIAETGKPAYRSKHPGRGHQCGHDGHMSIVLGVACALSRRPPARGRVVLLFQPAEETGTGARAVMADPRFTQFNPDHVLALHNLPGYERHRIVLKSGRINCASRGMRIRYTGKTAHASMPETGHSPALAMASTIRRISMLSTRSPLDEAFALVTVVHAVLGERAFGVAPGEAEIWATLRTVTDQRMERLVEEASALARGAAKEHALTCRIDFDDVFRACDNDDRLIETFRQSAADLGFDVTELDEPLRFSEDFGEYADVSPSAMFFLGAGADHPALHNPDYDFPDELIRSGALMFLATINRLLGSKISA